MKGRFSPNKRCAILILDGALLLFCLLVPFLTDFMRSYLPSCLLAAYRLPCPSCGGTRCVESFFALDFVSSFLYHPYIFCMILYGIAVVLMLNLYCLWDLNFAKKALRYMCHYKTIIILAAGYMLFGILRYFV